jgi:hypothetical protein
MAKRTTGVGQLFSSRTERLFSKSLPGQIRSRSGKYREPGESRKVEAWTVRGLERDTPWKSRETMHGHCWEHDVDVVGTLLGHCGSAKSDFLIGVGRGVRHEAVLVIVQYEIIDIK